MQFNNRLILKIIELVSYFETKKKKKKETVTVKQINNLYALLCCAFYVLL